VATFNPDAQVVQNIHRVASQVDHVLVVDDGSATDTKDPFLRLHPGIEVIRLPSNCGIAATLNVGARAALDAGADAVLTLDQDSLVNDNYVRKAREASSRLERAHRSPAIIAAGVQSGATVRAVRYADRGDEVTPTLEAIQSGLLIPATVFERIGWFDEELFIDCVDTDFILRASLAGVPTYLARGCAVEHSLGRRIRTTGVRVTRSRGTSFAYHPPWRRYYITRNRAIVFARFGLARPDWTAAGIAGELLQFARCLVFGPQKVKQVAAVATGLADALGGRRGRLRGNAARVVGAPQD